MKKHGALGVVGLCLFFSVAVADEIRYDSNGRRDPFLPLVGPGALVSGLGSGGKGLEVSGIVFDPKGASYALIGGEIYREGESLGGVKVIGILTDRVVFLQEGEEVVIWLREEILGEGQKGERP